MNPVPPAQPKAHTLFPLPLRVKVRGHDGSCYLEGGDPSGRHLAFDVACDEAQAGLLVEGVNGLAELARLREANAALEEILAVSVVGLDSGGDVHLALNLVKSKARAVLARAAQPGA